MEPILFSENKEKPDKFNFSFSSEAKFGEFDENTKNQKKIREFDENSKIREKSGSLIRTPKIREFDENTKNQGKIRELENVPDGKSVCTSDAKNIEGNFQI